VSRLIAGRTTNTAVLALSTFLIITPVAFLLGVMAGIRPGRLLDHAITVGSLTVIAVPEFVVGALLSFVFAVKLNFVPAVSLLPERATALDDPSVLILPIATLLLVGLAYIVRMLRAGIIEVMTSDYVELARLNGLSERRVVVKHAVRNALAPTVQVLALTLQWLIGGVVVVETLFEYQGLGQGLVAAVHNRDIPYVQAVTMIFAASYIAITIVADIVVILLVPKLRTA
jgi:peptide/nickel transport system permease protein